MNNKTLMPNFSKIQKSDLIIFLIPFIIFSFYLSVYNPGILTYDSFYQLHQIATGQFTNWHPFFHTFIEMLCLKVYASPISIGVLQILVFSTIWTVMCKYNRKDTQSDKIFIVQIILTLIISVIPINAIYAITLWKDVLFSYSLVFLCFLIQVLLDRQFQIDYRFAILISAVMAFASQIRPNGIYVILVVLVVLAIFLFKRNKTEKFYIAIPALTIIFILLIASLNVVYEVEDTQKDAFSAKVLHMLSNYDLNHLLDEKDSAKLHEVIDENTIKQNYNTFFTDPIRNSANLDAYNNDKGTYIGMAIKYSLQNPMYFIKYMLASSEMVWDITRDDYWQGKVYYIDEGGLNLENARISYFERVNSAPAASFENVTGVNEGTPLYNLLNSFVYHARTVVVLDTLFNSPALYMYLAFLVMGLIYYLTKFKGILLIYLPNALNIFVVFLSTPIQDNRYLYPSLLVFYLLLLILIGVLFKTDLIKTSDNSAKSFENQQPNPIETPEEMEARIRAEILRDLEMQDKK